MTTTETHAQHLDALVLANHVRVRMSVAKREISQQGSLPQSAALAAVKVRDGSTEMERMRLRDLLMALHRIGEAKARRVELMLGATPRVRLGALSSRQRDLLLRFLDESAGRR